MENQHTVSPFGKLLALVLGLAFLCAALQGCGHNSSAPGVQSSHDHTSRHALLFGINKYQDRKYMNELPAASNSARSIAATLQEVAAFPRRNVRLVTGDGEEKPNRANILSQLRGLAERVKPGDTVLVYFGGHGVQVDKINYLLTWNTDWRDIAHDKQTMLSVDAVYTELRKISAGTLIIIFEMCRTSIPQNSFSSDLNDALNKRQTAESDAAPIGNDGPNAVVTVFSSSPGENTWEWSEKENGYLSYFLQEGLRHGAADKKGIVRVSNLLAYLEKAVYGAVRRETGEEQRPSWSITGREPKKAANLILSSGRPSGAGGDTAVPLVVGTTLKERYDAAMQWAYELQMQGSLKVAEGKFEEALQLQPRSFRAADELARISISRKNDYVRAEQLYADAVKLNPENTAATAQLIWIYSAIKKDYVGAERLCRQAIKLNPQWAWPVSRLALLSHKSKKYKQAERLYRQAIKMKPQEGEYHANLALYLLDQNRRDEALAEARQAIKLGYKDTHPVFDRLSLNF